jgi:hypothetical protein
MKSMRKLPTTIALLAVITMGAAAISSMQLLAASPDTPGNTTPQGKDAPGPDNGTNAMPPAEKGVIPPPPTGDTGIQTQVPNPNAGTPEEVIPPPGTPGGNPDVEPR